jgi:uncharacterized repeat protein (TIGR01451 family)
VIDVAIGKTATSPIALNGTVTFTLTVTNVGTTVAQDVQVSDPAPAGITYTGAQPQAGVTCSVQAALVTCSRPGALPAGQSFQVVITGTATQTGTLANTATVTAAGGSEANLANNTASAAPVVLAPSTPPRPKAQPKPKPTAKAKPALCTTMDILQEVVRAGNSTRLTIRIASVGKSPAGTKILVVGPGIRKIVTAKASGTVSTTIRASRPGLITATVRGQKGCVSADRVGAIGALTPPVTG